MDLFGAGEIIGSTLDYFGNERTNDANAKQAEQNRYFQKWMTKHAHQYEVDDLKRAGLNPILSGTGGMGAHVPSGSMPAPMQNSLGSAVNTAMAYRRNRAETEAIQEDAAKKVQERRTGESQEELNVAQKILTHDLSSKAVSEKNASDALRARTDQETRNLQLENMSKNLDYAVRQVAQRGLVDAAKLNSSTAAELKRRSDMAAEAAGNWTSTVLPWKRFGGSKKEAKE